MKPRKWLAGPESYKLPSLSPLFSSSPLAVQAGGLCEADFVLLCSRAVSALRRRESVEGLSDYNVLAVVARLLPQVVDTVGGLCFNMN